MVSRLKNLGLLSMVPPWNFVRPSLNFLHTAASPWRSQSQLLTTSNSWHYLFDTNDSNVTGWSLSPLTPLLLPRQLSLVQNVNDPPCSRQTAAKSTTSRCRVYQIKVISRSSKFSSVSLTILNYFSPLDINFNFSTSQGENW